MGKRATLVATLILLLASNYLVISCRAWSNGGFSPSPDSPNYGTHDWIAEHALDWLPEEARWWINANLNWYLYGTELPDNGRAPDGIGDVNLHHVYFGADGALIDDSAARRANETFNQALAYMLARDFASAAKYAGAMTHYIADVAVFGHVMGGGTDWGAEEHHDDYERYVNSKTSSYNSDWSAHLSFDGELRLITAYDAAVELAYDTTFDTSGRGLTCVWMDRNYDWSNQTFMMRAMESINLAVNYVTDVLYTLYTVYAASTAEPTAPFDYRITLNPSSITLRRGESSNLSVHIEPVLGEALMEVRLSVSGAPEGISCRFMAESGIPPINTTLTLSASQEAPAGTYTLTVKATYGDIVKEARFSVTVIGQEATWHGQIPLILAAIAVMTLAASLAAARRRRRRTLTSRVRRKK